MVNDSWPLGEKSELRLHKNASRFPWYPAETAVLLTMRERLRA